MSLGTLHDGATLAKERRAVAGRVVAHKGQFVKAVATGTLSGRKDIATLAEHLGTVAGDQIGIALHLATTGKDSLADGVGIATVDRVVKKLDLSVEAGISHRLPPVCQGLSKLLLLAVPDRICHPVEAIHIGVFVAFAIGRRRVQKARQSGVAKHARRVAELRDIEVQEARQARLCQCARRCAELGKVIIRDVGETRCVELAGRQRFDSGVETCGDRFSCPFLGDANFALVFAFDELNDLVAENVVALGDVDAVEADQVAVLVNELVIAATAPAGQAKARAGAAVATIKAVVSLVEARCHLQAH